MDMIIFVQCEKILYPVILMEMKKKVWDVLNVAYKLLMRSQKVGSNIQKQDEIIGLIFALGKTNDWPHTHVINRDEANKIGLNISKDEEKIVLLDVYKKWVSCRLREEETTHIIEIFCPERGKAGTTENGKRRKE